MNEEQVRQIVREELAAQESERQTVVPEIIGLSKEKQAMISSIQRKLRPTI